MTNPYCTIDDLRDELRNEDTDNETELERAIELASRWVEWRVGRDYLQHDYSASDLTVDKYDGYLSGNVLFLPYYPVITWTSLTQGDTLLVEDEDYVRKDDRIINLTGDWIATPPDYVLAIRGIFGYAQDSPADVPTGLPQHIRIATIMAAAALSGHNRKEIINLDGSRTELIDRNIPQSVRDMLGQKLIL